MLVYGVSFVFASVMLAYCSAMSINCRFNIGYSVLMLVSVERHRVIFIMYWLMLNNGGCCFPMLFSVCIVVANIG